MDTRFRLEMKVDLEESGLDMFFKKWQAPLIEKLLTEDVEMKTAEAWEYVNDCLPEDESISRASIIFFLQKQRDEGTLTSREESGKGGMHEIYKRDKNLQQFLIDLRVLFTDKMFEAAEILGFKS